MNSVIMWIFSQTKIGQMLDGKKTVIGAVFVLLATVLQGIQLVVPMLPEYAWVGTFAAQFSTVMDQLEKILNDVGLGMLTVGVLHKNAKIAVTK
jgi:hypothetical protein